MAFAFRDNEVLEQRALVRMALERHRLVLVEEGYDLYSNVLATFSLTPSVLAQLRERGFEYRQDADGACLLDQVSTWDSSNSWRFGLLPNGEGPDPRVTVRVKGRMDELARGVVLEPRVQALTSAGCIYPNQRLFCVLTEMHAATVPGIMHTIAEHVIAQGLNYVVSLGEIDERLRGIRSLPGLFYELSGSSLELEEVIDIFTPSPRKNFTDLPSTLFVLEEAHSRLFRAWKQQFEEYRRRSYRGP